MQLCIRRRASAGDISRVCWNLWFKKNDVIHEIFSFSLGVHQLILVVSIVSYFGQIVFGVSSYLKRILDIKKTYQLGVDHCESLR